jgi:hypothetical protein
LTPIEKQPIAAGQPDMAAAQLQEPSHQACNRVGILRARNSHHRDPTRFTGFKQVVHDGPAYRARSSLSGIQMHQQTWPGVHLHNSSALLTQRLANVFGNHINTRHIQTNHARSERTSCMDCTRQLEW